MSRYLLILTMLGTCLAVASCKTYAMAGECPKWSDVGIEEFVRYNIRHGETHMVQDVKRRAQFCAKLVEGV